MNLLKKTTAMVLALSLSWGCVTPAPQLARSPRSDIASPTEELALALVVTQNTRDSATAYQKRIATWGATSTPFQFVRRALKRSFDSVTLVETIEEARAAEADVIAVMDMTADFKLPSRAYMAVSFLLGFPILFWTKTATVDLTLAFKDLQGTQVEFLHIRQSAKRTDPGSLSLPVVTSQAINNVVWRLEEALAKSSPLAEIARAKRGGAGIVTAAATAAVFKGRSDVDTPVYKAAPDPNSYALIIGVDKYESVPRAEYAERDARAVREHVVALGFPERNVILLTGEKVGRAALEKYIEAWLPEKVNSKSRVFVFFSGHGAPDADSGRAFLVPWDGDPKYLDITGYPVARLYENLNKLRAREVVLVMDACFSGAGGRSVLAKGTRPLITKVDTDVADGGKLVVLAASAADEVTGTDDKQGHGLFTYHFLKALNDTRGGATMKEIHRRLLPAVQDAARRQNRSQTPKLMGAAAKAGTRLKSFQ